MKILNWNSEKNIELMESRGRSFEEVVLLIQSGEVLRSHL